MLFSNVEQVEQIIEQKYEQNELTSSAITVLEKAGWSGGGHLKYCDI